MRRAPASTRLALALALPLLAAAAPARAAEGCAHCEAARAQATAPAARQAAASASVRIVDRPLRDQRGRSVRFARDVLGDDVVVLDFVFTHCGTVCPVLSAKMARLQQLLDGRLGHGVRLASLSLDPVRDTPERLQAWGGRFQAGPHWSLLTGEPRDVEAVLQGLGAWVADFTSHAPVVLVGDARTGRWTRVNGFPDPAKIAALVDELLASRAATARAGGH